MQDKKFIILSILKSFLGEPKSSINAESREQWEFNCISYKCKHDYNKHNLAFNSEKNVYKCWKCGEHGHISKLVAKYGSKEDNKKLSLILSHDITNSLRVFKNIHEKNENIVCPLPDGYTPILESSNSKMQEIALNYVTKERKIDIDQLLKYKIGYTEIGEYKNRIIIPSFNDIGKINYFEARSYLGIKPSYYKPDEKAFKNFKGQIPDKYDIIFNEKNINWDLPVYLVEGVFDMFRIPNSIPMLGKTPSWLLIKKIIENNATIIICLDEDAIKDGIEIYEMLESLGLNVYFVDLEGKGDISYHYEKFGQNAIVELLKKRVKINFLYKMFKLLK